MGYTQDLMLFFIFYFLLWVLMGGGMLATHLLRGFGLWRISKQLGIKGGVLGFVPVAWQFQYGVLAGEELWVCGRKLRSPGLWMVLLPIVSNIVLVVSYLVFVFGMIAQTFRLQSMSDDSFPTGFVIAFVCGLLLFVLMVLLVSTAQMLLTSLVNLRIFGYYMPPDRALVHTLLCCFVPLYSPIFLFILGKRTPVYPPVVPPHRAIAVGATPYPYQAPPVNRYAPPESPVAPPQETALPPAIEEQPKQDDQPQD